MDLSSLAKSYGTPLYVYDFDQVRENFLAFRRAFAGRKFLLCYALKANPNLSLLRFLARLGAGADCVSIGEVRRAILAGISRYKIIFSGVGKRDDEIKEALKEGILFLNVESFCEMQRVEKIAKSLEKIARISVRVNPNIDAKTHPYISTGLVENKFGVEMEEAREMYLYIQKSANLKAVGIHFHIGSQLCDLDPILQALQKIAHFYRSLLAMGLEDLRFFDVGGGLGIAYQDEQIISLESYAQGIFANLKGCEPTLICEAGRRIVGDAGKFLTKVIGQKSNQNKRFVIVDGAMNDFMRPTLYGARHQVKSLAQREKTLCDGEMPCDEETLCDIVGPVCESGDYLIKDVLFPQVKAGDLIAFSDAGAYGFSMASQYNSRPRVAEVGLMGGRAFLIRERETFEDLIQRELACLE